MSELIYIDPEETVVTEAKVTRDGYSFSPAPFSRPQWIRLSGERTRITELEIQYSGKEPPSPTKIKLPKADPAMTLTVGVDTGNILSIEFAPSCTVDDLESLGLTLRKEAERIDNLSKKLSFMFIANYLIEHEKWLIRDTESVS